MQNLITGSRLLKVSSLIRINVASFAELSMLLMSYSIYLIDYLIIYYLLIRLAIPKKKTTGKKRFRLDPVSQDPEYLCSHVAGLNYKSVSFRTFFIS